MAAGFQLPRIAKPSGTSYETVSRPNACGLVSTSPDSKAIRNLPVPLLLLRFAVFQLPRIAKPSGTMDRPRLLLFLWLRFNFPG